MRAAYDGIYFDIKQSIVDGSFGYRDFLPSESVLVNRYGCAHNTVRKALSILASEGYVQPIHGKGVRVIYRRESSPCSKRTGYDLRRITSFFEEGQRFGYKAQTKVLVMKTVEADESFSDLTGFTVGEQLLFFERVRYVDGRGLIRETNYFRSDIVDGITKEDAEQSIYRYIEKKLGHRLVTSRRLVTIDRASSHDKELLDLGDVDCLASVLTSTFDENGLLCEYTESRHHPEAFYFFHVAIHSRINAS